MVGNEDSGTFILITSVDNTGDLPILEGGLAPLLELIQHQQARISVLLD
jgi:hypothetical protein